MTLEARMLKMLEDNEQLAAAARAALEQLKPVLEKLDAMQACGDCGRVFESMEHLRRFHLVDAAGLRDVCPRVGRR